MHPCFRETMLLERKRILDRQARTAHLWQQDRQPATTTESVVLRLRSVQDDDALERLATLEGLPLGEGNYVLAQVAGVVVAALPLNGGRPLADPFRPTAHLMPLLEMRRRQLLGGAARAAAYARALGHASNLVRRVSSRPQHVPPPR